jgi:hypothetical protein
MGEYTDEIQFAVMHSLTHADLEKQNLIATEQDSDGGMFQTYMGRRVIVDDTLTPETGVYYTVFATASALAFADNTPARLVLESDRGIANGFDSLSTRRRYVIHPKSFSWNGTPAGHSPTNAELATAGSWVSAYAGAEGEDVAKRSGFVVLKHGLSA